MQCTLGGSSFINCKKLSKEHGELVALIPLVCSHFFVTFILHQILRQIFLRFKWRFGHAYIFYFETTLPSSNHWSFVNKHSKWRFGTKGSIDMNQTLTNWDEFWIIVHCYNLQTTSLCLKHFLLQSATWN